MRKVNAPGPHGARRDAGGVRLCSGERGFCAFRSLLWLAIMGCFIYVCVQAGPAFVNEYQFQDAIQTMARFASVNRQSADELRVSVQREAAKDGILLRPEDIRVTASAGNVRIEAAYSVTVDLRVYRWTINFHPTAANNSLT